MVKMKNYNRNNIFFAIFFSLLFSQINLFSQPKDVVLYTGTVKNDLGETVGAEIRFLAEGQSPTIVRSNSDGSYQLVLKQGKTYIPVFKGYIEIGGIVPLNVEKYDGYQELSKNYVVRQLKENLEIANINLFVNEDSTLSDDGKFFLKTFKEFYSLNKNTQFDIHLSAAGIKFKPKIVTQKIQVKGRTKTKKVKISAADLAKAFLQSRADSIQLYLKSLGLPLKLFNYVFDTNISGKTPTTATDTKIILIKLLKIN
jgi:hypothetical protein